MQLCEICHQNNGNFSAVIEYFYYRNICHQCKSARGQVSSGHARWSRSIDAEDHEAEIIQPYGADGKPNPKFIKLYPKQAEALFDQKQMRDANR